MPPEEPNEIRNYDVKRLSITSKEMLMKSKKLNLKLKFKRPSHLKNMDYNSHRNSMIVNSVNSHYKN